MLRSLIQWRKPERALARSSPANRLMDEFLGDWDDPFAFLRDREGWTAFSPPACVFEDEEAVVVRAEIPGITEKDVAISIREGMLVLSGEKKEEKEEKTKDSHWTERTFGRFERRIALPAEVDGGKASATCKDGILTVTLPKTPKAKSAVRKIEVQAG